MISMIVKLVVRNKDSQKICLWLPLFLVWIVLLPVFITAALVWAMMRLVTLGRCQTPLAMHLIESMFIVLWVMHGLKIDIRTKKSCIVLHF